MHVNMDTQSEHHEMSGWSISYYDNSIMRCSALWHLQLIFNPSLEMVLADANQQPQNLSSQASTFVHIWPSWFIMSNVATSSAMLVVLGYIIMRHQVITLSWNAFGTCKQPKATTQHIANHKAKKQKPWQRIVTPQFSDTHLSLSDPGLQNQFLHSLIHGFGSALDWPVIISNQEAWPSGALRLFPITSSGHTASTKQEIPQRLLLSISGATKTMRKDKRPSQSVTSSQKWNRFWRSTLLVLSIQDENLRWVFKNIV